MRWAALSVSLLLSLVALGGEPKKPLREVKELTLLYFHATWCRSCKRLDATDALARVKATEPQLAVKVVDVDAERDQVEKYGVEVTPTWLLVDRDAFKLAKVKITLDDPVATVAALEKAVKKATGK